MTAQVFARGRGLAGFGGRVFLCALSKSGLSSQPLDKMERAEVHTEAAKYVEKGFKLVAKEKVRASAVV